MLVKPENYMTIQGWMRTDLGLSGTELMVYAIIYGYTQSAQGRFTGSRQYLADWTGASVRTIQNVLNKLTDDGLLTKTTTEPTPGVVICEYVANFTPSENPARGPVKILHGPSEKSALYNIANNKEDNQDSISKEILGGQDEASPLDDDVASKMYSKEDFIGSGCRGKTKKKSPQPPKKNLYQKCIDANLRFTGNVITQSMLESYLRLRLQMKDKKPIYGVEQWQAMLDKLSELSSDDSTDQKLIRTAIEKGWASFFPVDDNKKQRKTVYDVAAETDKNGNRVVRIHDEEENYADQTM